MASRGSQPGQSPAQPPERRSVQSMEVGGRLLLAFTLSPGPLSLKDLASLAALPAARAHPYLVSFQRLGLVSQDPQSLRYRLGPAALQLGLTRLAQTDAVALATQSAADLAHETGLAVIVSVWGNLGPVVIRLYEARSPLHIALRVGSVMSITDTATGRAFGASLPAERVDAHAAVVDSPLLASSAVSVPPSSSHPALVEARQQLQAHGMVRAQGSPLPGVNAFSAPVHELGGEVACVLTVLGRSERVDPGFNGWAASALAAAVAQLEFELGARQRAAATPAVRVQADL